MTYTVSSGTLNPSIPYHTIVLRDGCCPGMSWADKQKHATNATLELRRIPADMNNIAKINEHFTRFGTLVNLQVSAVRSSECNFEKQDAFGNCLPFIALTLLVRQQEGHTACRKLGVGLLVVTI